MLLYVLVLKSVIYSENLKKKILYKNNTENSLIGRFHLHARMPKINIFLNFYITFIKTFYPHAYYSTGQI